MNMEALFFRWSLKGREESWKNTINNSLPVKIISFFISLLERYISPLSKESFSIKIVESFTIFSLMLLIFLSPFVSTDLNAILVLFAVLSTTLKHFIKPETISRHTDVLTFTVLAYFAIGLVSVGFSPYFMAALVGFSKNIIYLLAYFIFIVNLNSFRDIRLILWAIVISAGIMSLYGCYQFYIKVEPYQGALWDDPNATTTRVTRVYSFLKNPNLLAGYLIPTLSLSVSFYFMNLGWRRMIVATSIIVQTLSLYWTYSRGGWLAMIGIFAVFIISGLIIFSENIFKSKIFKWGVIAAFIIGFAGIFIFIVKRPETIERFASIFTTRGHSSNSFRMNVWIACINMFKENFLFGIGVGNTVFNKVYPLYMFSGFKALSAYNIFLETGVETGIFGLFIFIYMLFTHTCRCIWGIISKIEYTSRILLMGSLAGLTGLIIQGMFDTVWYRPQIHILLWLIIAIITVVSRNEMVAKKR
jgi:putative inorganic carbon (HCO3(-)) transporter